jgi:hypothetical protein
LQHASTRTLTAGKGGNITENQVINYETMLKVAKSISHSKDPEEVALMTVDSIKTALDVKGLKSSIEVLKTMKEVQQGRPPCTNPRLHKQHGKFDTR